MDEFRCKSCDAVIDLSTAHDGVVECKFCHNVYTVPTTSRDVRQQLLIAENELDACDFDRAYAAYSKAAAIESKEPEAHFGLALASFKVQYIRDTKDPAKKRLQPICHEASSGKFSENKHYVQALTLATGEQKKVYRRRAEEIDAINAEFYRLKKSGLRYDCFICVKVSDDKGGTTQDSHEALKLYNYLKKQGYSPFYSEEEMQGRVGVDYAALILYALYTSECMLIVCSDEDYLLTPWVRNEYTQFIELMEGERKDADSLAIVFKGQPIQNLPGRKGKIQGVSLNSATAYIEIVGFVDRHTPQARERKLKEAELKEREKELKAQQADAQSRLIEEMKAQLAALKAEQSKKKEEPKAKKEAETDASKEIAALKAELAAQLEAIKNTQAQATKVTFDGSLSGDALLEAMEQAKRDKAKREEEEYKKTYLQVGETVLLGHDEDTPIEWEVKEVRGDKAVIVSKYVLSRQSLSGSGLTGMNSWLNGFFPKYYLYGKETELLKEPFSLLTPDEARKYFPTQDERKKRAIWNNEPWAWWLNETYNTYTYCVYDFGGINRENDKKERGIVPKGVISSSRADYEELLGQVSKERKRAEEEQRKAEEKKLKAEKQRQARELKRQQEAEELAEQREREAKQAAERLRLQKLEEQRLAEEKAKKQAEEAEQRRIEAEQRRIEAELHPTVGNYIQEDFNIKYEPGYDGFPDKYILLKYCGKKDDVIIPKGVTHIVSKAFNGCTDIRSVFIPNSFICTITIDDNDNYDYNWAHKVNLFEDCRHLAFITVENGTENYYSDNNCLIYAPEKTLITGNSEGAMPRGEIIKIHEQSFLKYDTVKQIVIPEGVEEISGAAFEGCTALASVSLSQSIRTLNYCCFKDCVSLTKIDIPQQVMFIGSRSFKNCRALKEVTIASDTAKIYEGAFWGCSSLTSVTMPKKLKKYIKTAFDNKGKGIKFTFTK